MHRAAVRWHSCRVDLDDLEDLARRAATGDTVALDRLLAGSKPLVMANARKFLPNALDAEEAAQDALFAVARRIESFEFRSKYTTWLHQITTNASIDRYRKLKRRRSVLVDPPAHTSAAGSSPSVAVGARVDILEAAEQMDRRIIEPVLMRDLLDLSYAEIATLTDAPEGTVRSRVSEGRNELRRIFSQRS